MDMTVKAGDKTGKYNHMDISRFIDKDTKFTVELDGAERQVTKFEYDISKNVLKLKVLSGQAPLEKGKK